MIVGDDDEGMEIVVLVFLLLVGPLAVLAGRDSRVDDTDRRRHYLG
jgi:hypothetical protein